MSVTDRRVTDRGAASAPRPPGTPPQREGPSHTADPLRDALRARHDRAATDVRAAGRSGDMPALLDATRRVQQVLTTARRDLGPSDADTLVAEGSLAVALLLGYDRTGGRELATRNLAAREALLGPDHPASLAASDALAAAYRVTGEPDRAVRRHEDVITRRTRVLGPTHPCTIASRAALGLARADTGDRRGAAGLLAATLAAAERALGPGHAVTVDVRELLADCRAAVGTLADDGTTDTAVGTAAEDTVPADRSAEPEPPTGVLPRMRPATADAEPPTGVLPRTRPSERAPAPDTAPEAGTEADPEPVTGVLPRTPDPREETLPLFFDRPSGPLPLVR